MFISENKRSVFPGHDSLYQKESLFFSDIFLFGPYLGSQTYNQMFSKVRCVQIEIAHAN